MRYLKTTLTVIGAVTVLVLAGNTVALAATGHSLLLGKSNSADTYTSLTRTTSGTVLSLKSASSTNSPLSVNGKGKVANLNADTVDGIDSTKLQTRTTIYSVPATSGVSSFNLSLPALATPGKYHVTFSIIASMSSAGATLNCDFIKPGDTNDYKVISYGSVFLNYSTSNGSGFIDTAAAQRVFHCFTSSGTTTVNPDSPGSQITVTRVDSLTSATATAARVRPPSAGRSSAR